jgi:hypothetical protein
MIKAKEQFLSFEANVGDIFTAGTENPIRFETNAVRQKLYRYLTTRGNVDAKINHKVSIYMANLGSTA